MKLPVSTQQLLTPLATALERVFGSTLESVVIHGSAVTGDILTPLSDLDVLVILNQPWQVRQAAELHRLVSEIDVMPFARIQPKFVDVGNFSPVLVKGTFALLMGNEAPNQLIQSGHQLIESGEQWLQDLPALFRSDAEEWSLATGPTTARIARLITTRLKPACRAYLVRLGNDPSKVWAMHWDELANLIRVSSDVVGLSIDSFLTIVRSGDATMDEIGEKALHAVENLVALTSSTSTQSS